MDQVAFAHQCALWRQQERREDDAGKRAGGHQVSDILGDISVAFAHQSSGAEHVAQSVLQMDAVTQQSALLVVQAATAALALSQKAHQLQEAVDGFKV